jgi:hypothetical protein
LVLVSDLLAADGNVRIAEEQLHEAELRLGAAAVSALS